MTLLDQLSLPHSTRWIEIGSVEDAWKAIRDMTVRGAPAIAIAAALSVAVELRRGLAEGRWADAEAVRRHVAERLAYLVTSRPTAVNLRNAAEELTRLAASLAAAPGATAASVGGGVAGRAEAMLAEDVAANRRIGDLGADAVEAAVRARAAAGARGKPPAWARGRVPPELHPVLDDEEEKKVGGGGPKAGAEEGTLGPKGGLPSSSFLPPLVVMTHCNTGSLATAGYGTALGVLRSLRARGSLGRVVATETRPYWQGARLTAFELAHDGIPASLVPDGAAAAALLSGRVDAVVVGADRVSARGDVANKVGTLALALAARAAGVPFFVAAPLSTVDPRTPAGAGIHVELRSPEELTHVRGERVAAEGVDVWNPSFDVTPAELVAGVVTERGVVWNGGRGGRAGAWGSVDAPFPVGGDVDVLGLVRLAERRGAQEGEEDENRARGEGGDGSAAGPAAEGVPARALTQAESIAYVLSSPVLARHVLTPQQLREAYPEGDGASAAAPLPPRLPSAGELEGALGSSSSSSSPGSPPWVRFASSLTSREVGDGNINFVFEVRGPAGAVCLKQALPFVRMVGEGWPLSRDRLAVEHAALVEQRAWCPAHVPEAYWFDESLGLLAMRWIDAPARILRAGIVEGRVYPRAAAQAAAFCAETHYGTSYARLGWREFEAKRRAIDNEEMRELTQQVVFTDPYYEAEHNRHSDALDARVRALRADPRNAAAAAVLKAAFMHAPEALVHGDLHTGSLMATETELYVIDPEFAFYGPIAFEVGKLAANFLLAAYAVTGLDDDRRGQRDWLLAAASEFTMLYFQRFTELFVADARQRRNAKAGRGNEEATAQGTAQGEAEAPRGAAGENAPRGGAAEALGASTATGEGAPLPSLTSPRSLHHLPSEESLTPSNQVFADAVFASDEAATAAVEAFLRRVERDAVGFAGAVIVRRLIGIAHLAEFERIADPDERARREGAALDAGLRMLRGEGAGDADRAHPLLAAVRAEGPRVVALDGDEWDANFWDA